MIQDLRYGIRNLRRTPWSTAVTILSLAIGIGVNVSVFTAYKAFVLRPLDAQNPEQMVNIGLTRASSDPDVNFSYPDYEAYRGSLRSFSGLTAHRVQRLRLSSAGQAISERSADESSGFGRLGLVRPTAKNAEYARVFIVSENLFKTFGVNALRGQPFHSLKGPEVWISENYWQRRFSADPAIIGRTVQLNQVNVTIAGIAPRDFAGPSIGPPAFWIPASLEPLIDAEPNSLRDRENRRYRLFARLAPSVSLSQAQAEFNLAANRIRALHDPLSESAKPSTALVWPGSPFPFPIGQNRGLGAATAFIMFAALMILAVASANAGGLQLARARTRETELRTRLSLGATRLRVIRQLLTESALLGILAGLCAFLVSGAFLKVAVKIFADALPAESGGLVFDVSPNPIIFAFVLLISLTGGLLSGLAPALQSPSSALNSSDRAATASTRGRRLQNALVALQVALSIALMLTGAMFVRGAMHALEIDPGFDGKHIAVLDLQFPNSYTAAQKAAAIGKLSLRIAAIPGVGLIASARPPGAGKLETPAKPINASHETATSILRYTFVQPNYFEVLGIPLLSGSKFNDPTQGAPLAVLSESAARQLFGGENPVGRQVRLGKTDERMRRRSELVDGQGPKGSIHQVIGVVRDTRGFEFDGRDSLQIYLQLPTNQASNRPLLIRTKAAATGYLTHFEEALNAVDPEIAVTANTLESLLRQSETFVGSTMVAALSSILGAFGALLSLMGVFATVSYIVALRTREVGIRIAVGARNHHVLRLILAEIARPVLNGIAAGIVVASGVFFLLRGILYGIAAIDGLYLASVALVFFAIALLAALPPATRAMRVDPMVALRTE